MWFSKLYQKVMVWARHKHAPLYLAGVSFIEAIFFPIPPDTMLAPMSLANPKKAWRYAFITTIASVAGGVCAYALGMWAFAPLVEPLIHFFGWDQIYDQAHAWLQKETFYIVFLSGFTPIPYKLLAFTAGTMELNLLLFIIASFFRRAMRFYIVAGLMAFGGERLEQQLHKYIERIGWTVITILIGGYFLYEWLV